MESFQFSDGNQFSWQGSSSAEVYRAHECGTETNQQHSGCSEIQISGWSNSGVQFTDSVMATYLCRSHAVRISKFINRVDSQV
jgi:hypothetical protein